jgi:beta-lactamase regulating signal transducer with metallopeptidase domain
MWVWIDRAGPILFDAALSTAIFLSAIVLAMLVCRQPARRLQIARVALLASLAMLPLVALAPLPRLDLVNAFFEPSLLHTSATPGADSVARPGAFLPGLTTAWQVPDDLQDYVWIARQWLPRSLALLDLACVAVGFAWLLLGFCGVHWIVRRSHAPSPATSALFDRLTGGAANGRARPGLRVSPRVQRPVVVGVLRPTILIPPSYDESESGSELLRLVLLHEIAHAEQADPCFGTVACLAQTIWFFLPHVWWIRSQLLIDQEYLADRSAALRYGTPAEYAAALLSLAESAPNSMPDARPRVRGEIWPEIGDDGSRSPLFQRMLMLLNCPFRVDARAARWWSWTGRLTVIAAALLAACLCIRRPYDGAGALERFQSAGLATADESFHVADFVAEPLVFLSGGRALPYIMPVALPTHFDLTVDVFASMTELANVHIAGHPIGERLSPAVSEATWGAFAHTDAWHQIRLLRQGFQLSLWVDGQKLPVLLNPQATSEWLTFEPSPERAAHFRNLFVNW